MKKEKGFTLVEIMIVLAILGLLVSLSIPNIMRLRVVANETSMKRNMKTFSTANESYRTTQNPPSYASVITDLTSTSPTYLDSTWATGMMYGFQLSYRAITSTPSTYALVASPSSGSGLNNTFCVDQSGIVYAGTDGVSGDASGCFGGTPLNA